MNYISLLTKEEITILCNIISGKVFRGLFQKNSHEFAKIKPGFRPNRISPKDAEALAVRYIEKPFIADFVNANIQKLLQEMEKSYTDMLFDGKDEYDAMADIISKSCFLNNISLYFKLIGKEVDDKYLAKLKDCIMEIDKVAEQEINIYASNSVKTIDAEAMREQLEESERKLKDCELELENLKEKNISMEQAVAEAQINVEALESDKQEMEMELATLRARMQYDDTDEAITTVETQNFEYVSFCEVAAPDYAGQVWLTRLADISRNGNLEVFYENEDMPPYFSNRSKLFFKDGPSETGAVGVWNWNVVPNNNDSSRDYVTSQFNAAIEPIEIIIVLECQNSKALIEQLKVGIDAEITSRRVIFAVYLSKGQYIGLLCRHSELEQNGKQIRLRKKVISLPQYVINRRDQRELSNRKIYYKSLRIGIPSKIVTVKDGNDIVRTVILERNSWQMFKQQGKTRGEWKNIKGFLEGLDAKPIVKDISISANCSLDEAQKMLDGFIAHAEKYIDGMSIEDEVISAVMVSRPELMERCKGLIKEDWLKENKDLVEGASGSLNEIKKKIQQARSQLDKECAEAKDAVEKQKAEAEKELAAIKKECDAVRHEHDTLKSTLKVLTTNISKKEQLAIDVEKAVEQRICQAQDNAAEFIAKLAFLPQYTITAPENNISPSKFEVKTSTDEVMCYVSGEKLNQEDIEEISSWNAMIDMIGNNLNDAGVKQELSYPLAAYLYAAYMNKIPLLLLGPNAGAIVDAFSGAVLGKMAGILECTEKYSAKSVEACYSSEDWVVKVVNPFSADWISRIPDIVSNEDKFFVAIYPYAEDIQIEPKSLYNYMLPVFTELFISKSPKKCILGGHRTDDYMEFGTVKTKKNYNKLLTDMHTSSLTRNKIQILIANMHTMLNDKNPDYDVIFALLPYAYATMQTALIMDAVMEGPSKKIDISSRMLKLLNGLYGDGE